MDQKDDDNLARVKTLVKHLENPISLLLSSDGSTTSAVKSRVNSSYKVPALDQLTPEPQSQPSMRIVTDTKEWDKRKQVGIVDSKSNQGIVVKVDPNHNPAYVPHGYLNRLLQEYDSPTAVEDGGVSSVYKLLSHLQFLLKKDSLAQDSFLIGPPGNRKRHIAMAFCELAGREVEFLSISQDTTVADIKQRREIRSGTALFEDSCAVRAAIHGRVLILEGVEKAERNVLSTLNNLLENREMSLEDGRFLTNPTRFDEMIKDHGKEHLNKRWREDDVRLVRVSDRFRVICLGVPVPEYEGNPLDPPFRSRFQSRDVNDDHPHMISAAERSSLLMSRIYSSKMALESASVLSLDGVSTRALKRSSIPGEYQRFATDLLNLFPNLNGRFLIACLYPTPHLGSTDPTHRHLIMEILERHGLLDDEVEGQYIENVVPQKRVPRDDEPPVAELGASTPRTEFRDRVLGPRFTSRLGYKLESKQFNSTSSQAVFLFTRKQEQVIIRLNLRPPPSPLSAFNGETTKKQLGFIQGVEYHDELVAQMVALYSASSARPEGGANCFTVVGNRGTGKTILVKQFASMLNLNVVFFPLHRDMTSQDLFMRRATLANGDTIWTPSPLLSACERGDLLVLDSVEAMAPATLGTLCSLLSDREASLPDGTRLRPRHMKQRGLATDRIVHPDFRIIALGRPAASDTAGRARPSWLTSEVLSSFLPFLWVRTLSDVEERQIIESLLPEAKQDKDVQRLLALGQYLRTREDEESRSLSLSTRQLIRISRRICLVPKEQRRNSSELVSLVHNACLYRFLPPLARQALDAAMMFCEIRSAAPESLIDNDGDGGAPETVMLNPPQQLGSRLVIGKLRIGQVEAPIFSPKNEQEKSLVPDTYFVENPRQTRILKGMLQDYLLGSHLLLLGNQGTGKNKLVDRLLHLLKLPREYIQLDRDTTVNALTSQPVVEDGVVRYEDSPLVKAARYGRILVVDEADKAPTHVTAILKSLLADGEMLLSDGRRLVSSSLMSQQNHDGEETIQVHPDFRAIVLANRPGYPFLGNDLYRETGDIFAPHVVDNPDEESELALLRQYAPNVPEETLRKLTAAFQDLRGLVNDGKLLYPYSTRELVNAVKHMEKFPRDGLAVTLQNVFDFDRYAVEDRKTISVLFERHGIPVSLNSKYQVKTGDLTPLPEPILTETWRPSASSSGATKKVVAVNYVIHAIDWKAATTLNSSGVAVKSTHFFPLVLSATKVPLIRHEGRAQIFDEQLFSFSLPTAEFAGHGVGIVGACTLNDFSLVCGANDAFNALRLYHIKSPSAFRDFDVYDVAIPHFNFRDEFIPNVRRPAPSRCSLFAMPKQDQFGMFSHDDQTLFIMDLNRKQFQLVQIDAVIFRQQQATANAAPVGLYTERMRTLLCTDLCTDFGVLLIYQQLSKVLLIFDLITQVRMTIVLPFPIDILDITSPFTFLIRSANANGKQHLLKATGTTVESSSDSDSTNSLAVAGTSSRASVIYTSFHLVDVEQNRIDVASDGSADPSTQAGGSNKSSLHGAYSYLSYQPIINSAQSEPQLIKSRVLEKRFVKSPGTVCQIMEGYSQTFIQDEMSQETYLRSYLRTNLTRNNADTSFVATHPLYLKGTSMLASLSVKRKRLDTNIGRLSLGGGYLGFENEAILEIADLQRNNLRVIKVSLPDTNRRNGSAVLSEKFDPDGVQVHDELEEEPEQDETKFTNVDEASTSIRQRAPFLFCFQTLQGDLLTLDRTGIGRIFQIDQDRLDKALESWKSMIGQNANDDDLDFDDGEEDEDEDEEGEDDDEEFDEDEEDEEDEEEEDGENDGEDGEEEHDDADGEPNGEKGKKGQKGGKSKRGGGKSKKGGKKGGKGKSSRRGGNQGRRGGRNQRGGGGRRPGNGQGQGQGQGSGGGQGQGGGSGGDPNSLPEPGQFRGPRPLSLRDKQIAQARLDELKRLTRYFPNDERIRGELESLEERLDEAEEAERMSKGLDSGNADKDAMNKRMNNLKQRLAKLEAEIADGRSQGRNTARLEAEAQQLRGMIGRLEQQQQEQGEGEGGEDGDGEGGRNGRGKGGKAGKAKNREMDEQARKQAKKMEKEAWKEVMESLDANPQDAALYQRYKDSVSSEIRELRATLDQMHAKKNERVWLRNKDVGDLDDRRLVDGLTGERNIYKRRGDRPPDPFAFQDHPKRLTFLFDVSSSMSRYSMDGRLERSLEAATMAMEAFKGYEHKFAWRFRGHSGSSDDLVFVEPGKYPKDDSGRLDVLRRMNAHAETCGSGDNTLEATKLAIRELPKDEADEYFCILFSDANIEQYSIKPADLKALLDMDERVNLFIVFIGSMGLQAQRLRAELPQDRVFVTLSTSQIPAVLKRIFLSSVLKD